MTKAVSDTTPPFILHLIALILLGQSTMPLPSPTSQILSTCLHQEFHQPSILRFPCPNYQRVSGRGLTDSSRKIVGTF